MSSNDHDKCLEKVKNGGKLTHTDTDFLKAEFFFCNGLDDPWLSEYVEQSILR